MYVELPNTTNDNRYQGTITPFEVGDAVFLSGIDGNLGTGRDMTLETGRLWSSRYDTRRHEDDDHETTQLGRDCNGWWVISAVALNADDSAIPTDQIRYEFNVRNLSVQAGYAPSAGAFCCGGRIGGPQVGYEGVLFQRNDDDNPAIDTGDILDGFAGVSYGLTNSIGWPMGGYAHFPTFYGGLHPAEHRIGTFFQQV